MAEKVYLFGHRIDNLTPRQLRRKLRRIPRRKTRQLRRKLRKKLFGPCPVCRRPGGPGHTCRMRYNQRTNQRLRKRLDQRGVPESPLRKGR